MTIVIREGDFGEAVQALLAQHLAGMHANSPPGSVHALPLDHLRAEDITFWSAWDGAALLGVGALKMLEPAHGEIKSMRTAYEALGRGVGTALLRHILAVARARGCTRVSLETGRTAPFHPAHRLYRRHGFTDCAPFGPYREDAFSRCMTLRL